MPNPTHKNNPVSGTSGGSQNARGEREENTPSSVRGGSQRPSSSGGAGATGGGSSRGSTNESNPGYGGSSGSGGSGGSSSGGKTGSGQSQAYGGPQGSNSGGSNRDPSQRTTSKPDATLGNTSETSIMRTCANTCYETFTYGIREGGKQFEPEQLIVLLDAAETCTFVANMVARGSEYVDPIKTCCADIVKAAEEMCEEYQDDDEMFKACADVCRECYEHLVSSE